MMRRFIQQSILALTIATGCAFCEPVKDWVPSDDNFVTASLMPSGPATNLAEVCPDNVRFDFLDHLAPDVRNAFVGRVSKKTSPRFRTTTRETISFQVDEYVLGAAGAAVVPKIPPKSVKLTGCCPELVTGSRYFIFARGFDDIRVIVPLDNDSDGSLVSVIKDRIRLIIRHEMAQQETVTAILCDLLPPWKTVHIYEKGRPQYREYPYYQLSCGANNNYSIVFGSSYSNSEPCLIFDPILPSDKTTVTGRILPGGAAFALSLVYTNGGYFTLTNKVVITSAP